MMIQPYPLASTPGLDPAPDVPTPEEIGQAESLRHDLEVLYLNRPRPSSQAEGGVRKA
jgi:hypothetical protein